MTTIEVHIHGQKYKLTSEGGPEYVKELARYVEQIMKDIARRTDIAASERVATMAALQIADEFFQLKQHVSGTSENTTERVTALIQASDQLLLNL